MFVIFVIDRHCIREHDCPIHTSTDDYLVRFNNVGSNDSLIAVHNNGSYFVNPSKITTSGVKLLILS